MLTVHRRAKLRKNFTCEALIKVLPQAGEDRGRKENQTSTLIAREKRAYEGDQRERAGAEQEREREAARRGSCWPLGVPAEGEHRFRAQPGSGRGDDEPARREWTSVFPSERFHIAETRVRERRHHVAANFCRTLLRSVANSSKLYL